MYKVMGDELNYMEVLAQEHSIRFKTISNHLVFDTVGNEMRYMKALALENIQIRNGCGFTILDYGPSLKGDLVRRYTVRTNYYYFCTHLPIISLPQKFLPRRTGQFSNNRPSSNEQGASTDPSCEI